MSAQTDIPDADTTLPDSYPSSWKAELDLAFEAAGAKTRLIRRRQFGPLAVQRPFYPEKDGTCHVYLLHPPGGVAGGDELTLTIEIGTGARCLLTTPGAAKFYRSPQRGLQRSAITVEAGGACEYLPQETILFNGANAEIETRVRLSHDAMYVGWDFVCLGRPAANEQFNTGSLSQLIEVVRAGERIWYERFSLRGGSPLLQARYAFAGQPVFGTMICSGRLQDGLAERVRDALGEPTSVFSISQLDEIVVCRYLGQQAEEGKSLFTRAWGVLRSALQAKAACPPRIWAT